MLLHVPAREPKTSMFTTFILFDHDSFGAMRVGSSGGQGDAFRSKCKDDEGVGCGHQYGLWWERLQDGCGGFELMKYIFSSFSLRLLHTYSCEMLVMSIFLLSSPTTAKGRGGSAHSNVIFSFIPTSSEKHLSDPTGVPRLHLRELKNRLFTTFIVWFGCAMRISTCGAKVSQAGLHARRIREWGMGTSTASTLRRCRTVAALYELMSFFSVIFSASLPY